VTGELVSRDVVRGVLGCWELGCCCDVGEHFFNKKWGWIKKTDVVARGPKFKQNANNNSGPFNIPEFWAD
jgi:hypothetical protein